MKSIVFLFLLFFLSQDLFPQQKGGSGRVQNESREQLFGYSNELRKFLNNTVDDNYVLELFPGQKFDGWYYFWSNGGLMECNLKEDPEVQWLSINPHRFGSTGCTNIIPVKYSFVAPATEGVYVTTVTDSLGNWDPMGIELIVTKSPEYYRLRKFGVNQDIFTYRDYLEYYPFNWYDNTCMQDYFSGDSMLFNFYIFSVTNWLSISPSTGKIFRNETKDFRPAILKTISDSAWIFLERQYYSYPMIYRCYIKETEPKDYILQFNGQNEVTTDYYPGSSTKTLMFWVKVDTISTQGVGAHDFENHRFYLGIQNDNFLFAGMGNSYTPLTSLNLIPGKWYHMALTTSSDSDSALVYINATEVSRFAYSFSGESKAELYIGARNDSNYYTRFPVKGLIDEVQVWERPLTRNEIINYMFSPPQGNESGLAIYYSFNEGWGNFAKNAVDNYNYGLTYGEPQWIKNVDKPESLADLITSVEQYYPDDGNTIRLSSRPNPFNKSAEISFNLPENGEVVLQLFDIRGTLVRTLLNANMTSGVQTYSFNDGTLPKGMYFVKLAFTYSKGRFIHTIKIIRSDL